MFCCLGGLFGFFNKCMAIKEVLAQSHHIDFILTLFKAPSSSVLRRKSCLLLLRDQSLR